MSISSLVQKKISGFKKGSVFTCANFAALGNFQAVSLALSRLNKTGAIKRLSKGQYCIPDKTKFGTPLMPSENQIMELLLKKNGGYFAGISALSRMGITTQVPSEIILMGSRSNRKLRVGNLRVRFIKGGCKISSAKDLKLTNVLETLRLFKQISAPQQGETILKLNSCLKELDDKETQRLITLSSAYRPWIRALLGALLQNLSISGWRVLKDGLNPISAYNIDIADDLLPNQTSWRIR